MKAAGLILAALVVLVSGASAAVRPNASFGPVVVFADAEHGWAAGQGGILGTTDGGTSWRLESTLPVQALDAVDAEHAWAISGSALLRTSDGFHWSVVGHPDLPQIDLVDRERGYALGPYGGLLLTDDGGATWRRLHTPLAQALCATATTVWIARSKTIWRVSGGRVARVLTARLPGTGPGWTPALSCAGSDVWVLFTGGAAAGSQAYRVARSLAGGRLRIVFGGLPFAIRQLPPLDAYSGPFQALGHGAAVLIGFCPACGSGTTTFVRTVDGAATFHRSPRLDLGWPYAISFRDLSHGFFLSSRALWRTDDGGRSWRPILRTARLAPTSR